jgi:hypothetical protein
VKLKGRADTLELKAYSQAWILSLNQERPAVLMRGWNPPVSVDLNALPNGTWYLKLRAKHDGHAGDWVSLKAQILR